MNPNAPQSVVRTLLVEADHQSRAAYARHDDDLSTRFAALRTECARLERRFGSSKPRPTTSMEIDHVYERVLALAAKAIGHESRVALDAMVRVAQRLRAPAPKTLMGFAAVKAPV